MIASYKKKSNIAAAVCGISGVCLMLSMNFDEGNIWDNGNISAMVSITLSGFAFIYAVWAYAKAKGRSGFWVLAALFGSVLGLIIIACLKDKFPDSKVNKAD